MNGLQQFWTWVYLLGLGAFIIVSVAIIPLGFRDLLRLLKDLEADKHGDEHQTDR